MVLSFPRPDPSSPDAVAKASFATARRGFDQSEVRDFLRMVAAELARLQERERYLDRELRTAQRGAPNPAVALDEEVVTRLLGEEAARILSTSREAASQIKIRAEDAAARLLREAADEAQRVREEAQLEGARRRQDAAADAESELEMAKQQGREMVNEARAYRERVLSELARRRELAREQIEQLVHGRDRLVQAFERARLAAVDVMSELIPLGEPTEYVNLALTTGPVPVMVPNQQPPVVRPTFPRDADTDTTRALSRDAAPPEPAPAAAADDVHEPADGVGADDSTADDRQPATVVALFAGEVIVDEVVIEPTHHAAIVDETAFDEQPADVPAVAESDAAADGNDQPSVLDDARTAPADPTADADAVGAEPATVVEVIELDVELEPAVAPDGPDATTESDVDAEPADAETATETAAETDAEIDAETAAAEIDAGADAGVDVVIDADAEIAADGPEPDGADVARADESAHESANEASAAAPTETPTETPTDTDAAGVDDLFARLRAARAASVAERARIVPTSPPAAAGTSTPAPAPAVAAAARPEPLSVFDPSPAAPEASGEVDDSPFGRRDAALTPIILACARKLKRVLADEQNDVLHSLRRTTVVTSIETVLSTEVEHGQRYIAAIATELADASVAGASSVSGKSRSELMRRSGKSATAPANDALVSGIVAPLRHRLARAVTDAAGDNGELSGLVRGIYREWKIQQIDEHLDEVVRIAFGRGALAALDPGTPVHWVHDPRFPVCADCDDNTLSGVIGAGEPFATGQACAPAHEGCRCMLATVAG